MNKGQTLFEVVAIVAIVAILVTSIVSVVAVSVRNSRFSKTQAEASRWAQEGMEWVRQQRDTNWSEFSQKSGDYCMQNLNWTPGRCAETATIANTSFVRNVTITPSGADYQVDVIVSWKDSNGSHQSRLTTVLTNWQGQ